jgi:hypothetical protein
MISVSILVNHRHPTVTRNLKTTSDSPIMIVLSTSWLQPISNSREMMRSMSPTDRESYEIMISIQDSFQTKLGMPLKLKRKTKGIFYQPIHFVFMKATRTECVPLCIPQWFSAIRTMIPCCPAVTRWNTHHLKGWDRKHRSYSSCIRTRRDNKGMPPAGFG